jgi:hypothetical protein
LGKFADGGCFFGFCVAAGIAVGVFGFEGGGYFGVEDGESVEEAGLVVVEGHADLVADGGAGAADVVGLPEGGDFGDEVVLEGFEVRLGDWDAVELLEEIGDAPALEHDGAAGDFCWVRGEDGRDTDATEEIIRFGGGEAGFAEAAEGSAEVAALRRNIFVELGGETAALAVVGLGEVDELEIEAESSGELVGGGEVVGVAVDAGESLIEVGAGGGGVGFGVGLASGDGGAAEVFDGGVEGVAGLLAEDLT